MENRLPRLPMAGATVEDIVAALSKLLEGGSLPPGARMPSVRSLAAQQGISRYAVVEAYERLVALGRLVARRGSGFFVSTPTRGVPPAPRPVPPVFDVGQLIRRVLEDDSGALRVGARGCPTNGSTPASSRP